MCSTCETEEITTGDESSDCARGRTNGGGGIGVDMPLRLRSEKWAPQRHCQGRDVDEREGYEVRGIRGGERHMQLLTITPVRLCELCSSSSCAAPLPPRSLRILQLHRTAMVATVCWHMFTAIIAPSPIRRYFILRRQEKIFPSPLLSAAS